MNSKYLLLISVLLFVLGAVSTSYEDWILGFFMVATFLAFASFIISRNEGPLSETIALGSLKILVFMMPLMFVGLYIIQNVYVEDGLTRFANMNIFLFSIVVIFTASIIILIHRAKKTLIITETQQNKSIHDSPYYKVVAFVFSVIIVITMLFLMFYIGIGVLSYIYD